MKKSKQNPTRIIETFVNEINAVNHSPRFQIIITQGVLELFINTLVEHKCKHADKIMKSNRDYSYSIKLVLLHEKGVISDLQFKFLDALRYIRNKAAHEAQFELKNEMLAPFKGQFSVGLNLDLEESKNFPHLCGEIVMGFWNDNVKLFAPIFEPHLFAETKSPTTPYQKGEIIRLVRQI